MFNHALSMYVSSTCSKFIQEKNTDSRQSIRALPISLYISYETTIRRKLSWLCEEKFEDTKGVIRIRISKKNRQHNGPKKKYKKTNNDIQSIYIKLKNE
jgi:hypothetical protein